MTPQPPCPPSIPSRRPLPVSSSAIQARHCYERNSTPKPTADSGDTCLKSLFAHSPSFSLHTSSYTLCAAHPSGRGRSYVCAALRARPTSCSQPPATGFDLTRRSPLASTDSESRRSILENPDCWVLLLAACSPAKTRTGLGVRVGVTTKS